MRFSRLSLLALLSLTCSWAAADEEVANATATEEDDGKDKYDLCPTWAEKGECDSNPEYMKRACPNACEEAKKHKEAMLKEVESIKSIHELSAKDIDGNEIKFSDYDGYVIIFVNVIAADNMMSEAHYKGLVELQERVKNEKVKFFLFPTEQFVHEQDKLPEDKDDLVAYFTNKGLLDDGTKFTIMEPIKVNGPEAHLVYKFAKYDASPPVSISSQNTGHFMVKWRFDVCNVCFPTFSQKFICLSALQQVNGVMWNFDPYFLVHPNGDLESRHRVHPEHLFEPIMEHFGSSEL